MFAVSFVTQAFRHFVIRSRRAAVDREFERMFSDPEWRTEAEAITKEIEGADRETWAALDREYGFYPVDGR